VSSQWFKKERERSMESAEIGNIGERHVEAWLKTKGYVCNRNTKLPGATDIEAVATGRSLLVQVKTAQQPYSPATLTQEEISAIKARAQRLNFEPWLAQVKITISGSMIGEPIWTQF
jgi:Holliday junction resolvase-like predicted endonuclease